MMKRGDILPPDRYREDFAPLRVDNPVCYLDNACTTMRPDSVVNAVSSYYNETPACGGRSPHRWGYAVTLMEAQARKSVANFLSAEKDEVIFTLNSTTGINQVAQGIQWQPGDIVLSSDKEHNSNLVPWLQLQGKGLIEHRQVDSNSDNTFDLEAFEDACSQAAGNLRLVAIPYTSNLDGVTNPVKEITKIAHDFGAEILLDSAQAAPHIKLDVKDIDCDYMTFSIHKMLGPSGVGVLYGKEESLGNLESIRTGGKTVSKMTTDSYDFVSGPSRFEGGSSNYAGIAGVKAAIEYLSRIDKSWLAEHEVRLNKIITDGVKDLDQIKILGPEDPSLRGGVTAMSVDGIDVHDLAIILDEAGSIMVRSGFHCVNSWFDAKKISGGSLRTSAYLYNNEDEAHQFVEVFGEALDALTNS
jgi:cysteine desulfurase/selenocysteine lyase